MAARVRPGHAAAMIAAVTCSFLNGCQSRKDGRRDVTLWHQMRPEDRAVLGKRIKAFEESHPDIRVHELYKETEELRSGLVSAVLAGRVPELIYGPSDVLGMHPAMGGLAALSCCFTPDELRVFDPRAVIYLPARDDAKRRELVFIGDRFGNHLALVYNRHFVPKPPKYTHELVELAKANTVDDNVDGVPERYGLV